MNLLFEQLKKYEDFDAYRQTQLVNSRTLGWSKRKMYTVAGNTPFVYIKYECGYLHELRNKCYFCFMLEKYGYSGHHKYKCDACVRKKIVEPKYKNCMGQFFVFKSHTSLEEKSSSLMGLETSLSSIIIVHTSDSGYKTLHYFMQDQTLTPKKIAQIKYRQNKVNVLAISQFELCNDVKTYVMRILALL